MKIAFFLESLSHGLQNMCGQGRRDDIDAATTSFRRNYHPTRVQSASVVPLLLFKDGERC